MIIYFRKNHRIELMSLSIDSDAHSQLSTYVDDLMIG